jgi:hypothetical protein
VTFLAVDSESMVTEIEAWIDSHLFQTIHFQQSIQETVFAPDWEGREGSSSRIVVMSVEIMPCQQELQLICQVRWIQSVLKSPIGACDVGAAKA